RLRGRTTRGVIDQIIDRLGLGWRQRNHGWLSTSLGRGANGLTFANGGCRGASADHINNDGFTFGEAHATVSADVVARAANAGHTLRGFDFVLRGGGERLHVAE